MQVGRPSWNLEVSHPLSVTPGDLFAGAIGRKYLTAIGISAGEKVRCGCEDQRLQQGRGTASGAHDAMFPG